MKKLISLFLILSLAYGLSAQKEDSISFEIPDVEHVQEGIGGALNFSNIGDQYFVGFRFTPDISFGKLGFGLNIPLLVNVQTGQLRVDEFQDGVGALRIIRYVRWGIKKRDPFYIRFGELSDARIGFGGLLSDYNNTISYEKRKLGIEFDLVVKKKFGIEMLYSDIDPRSFNLLAVRPYYKPFGATGIPIVKTFEIGASYITDHDQTVLTQTDSTVYRSNYFLDKGINSFGADMGFYIFTLKWLRWSIYTQFGYMPKVASDTLQSYINSSNDDLVKNYTSGMGWSVGSDFKFNFFGNLLKINYRAERFQHTAYYLPHFYSFAYELNKDARILEMVNTPAESGMYFKLGASVLDKIIFKTNIIFPETIDADHPAEMYVGLDLSNISDKMTFYTSMYKNDIRSFDDVLHFDENTLFDTRLGWLVYEVPIIKLQFTAGFDFKWTYAFLENKDFTATRYFSPFFDINLPLNREKENNKNEE